METPSTGKQDEIPRRTVSAIPESVANFEAVSESQSAVIFNGVYEQIRKVPAHKTAEAHGADFIAEIDDGLKRHIDAPESSGLTIDAAYQETWQRIAEYLSRYQSDSRFERKKSDVSNFYTTLQGHVNRLLSQQAVDERTAKVFLRSIPGMKDMSANFYNDLVRDHEPIPKDAFDAKNREYAAVLNGIVGQRGSSEIQEQDTGGFVVFNPQFAASNVKNRIYINAKMSNSPAQVVQLWEDTLRENNLQDKLYFKVNSAITPRFETMVLYITDTTSDNDVEKALTTFAQKCPPELLNDQAMPTGVPLHRGIAMAPEPSSVNNLIRFEGLEDKTLSYNELIASLTKLSFELAFKEAAERGEARPTPKSTKESAAAYFDRLLKLSGVNPQTMVPNAQGGQYPEWAKRLMAQ